jgi:3-oxoacyl-[acyl-carrier protein] reductase
MCLALGREGARVIVWDLDIASASSVADRIWAQGGAAHPWAGDVTDGDTVRRIAGEILGRWPQVHGLVNCAGFSRDAPLPAMTDEQWDAVIAVCLTAPFKVTRAFVPSMIEHHYGRIVNISSRARYGDDNKSNYSAAKAGIVGLTAAWAIELGGHGITANAIAPGFCETERTRGLPYYPELRQKAMERTFTDHLGTPDDIATATCYLLSPAAGYVSGEVVTIAGGRLR